MIKAFTSTTYTLWALDMMKSIGNGCTHSKTGRRRNCPEKRRRQGSAKLGSCITDFLWRAPASWYSDDTHSIWHINRAYNGLSIASSKKLLEPSMINWLLRYKLNRPGRHQCLCHLMIYERNGGCWYSERIGERDSRNFAWFKQWFQRKTTRKHRDRYNFKREG